MSHLETLILLTHLYVLWDHRGFLEITDVSTIYPVPLGCFVVSGYHLSMHVCVVLTEMVPSVKKECIMH